MQLKENFLFKPNRTGFSPLFLLGLFLFGLELVLPSFVPQAIYKQFLPPVFLAVPLMVISGWIEAD